MSDQARMSRQPTVDSAGGRETATPTARIIIARLLAVLVVAMVVISIIGFVVFDRQGGNPAAATTSLVIGAFSAVLGLLFGFLKAFNSS